MGTALGAAVMAARIAVPPVTAVVGIVGGLSSDGAEAHATAPPRWQVQRAHGPALLRVGQRVGRVDEKEPARRAFVVQGDDVGIPVVACRIEHVGGAAQRDDVDVHGRHLDQSHVDKSVRSAVCEFDTACPETDATTALGRR